MDEIGRPTTAGEAQDQVIVEALISGASYAEAGRAAGVTARTVARRMAMPEFSARVGELRCAQLQAIADQFRSAIPDALEVVRTLLHDADRQADQLKAATILMRESERFQQAANIEQRLAAIEKLLEADDGPGQA